MPTVQRTINKSFIRHIAVLNQKLMQRSLTLGLETKQLQYIDRDLMWLLHKSNDFDFVAQIARGMTLLLGEGNLSFALYLVENNKTTPHRIVATTFENEDKLSDEAKNNSKRLKALQAVEGRNSNFILMRDFLKSAALHLHRTGQVIVTIVDNSHYRGAFQIEEAAKIASFENVNSYAFDPLAFEGYEHTMTHQNENALDGHNTFRTWVFRK